jgi:hypothetical protein
MKQNIITLIIILIFSSSKIYMKDSFNLVSEKKLDLIHQMEWVLGEWISESSESISYENWVKINDTLLRGKSFTIKKNDTIFSESISLLQINGELFYIPTVNDQNDGLPVKFKLVSNLSDDMEFENTLHDFPQKIIYHNYMNDSLWARIEGFTNDKFKSINFRFGKRK